MDDVMGPLPPELRDELQELTDGLCKVLNDPKRLMLLYALGEGARSVSALAAALDAPQTNVSQHLALFRERGLVDTERRGASIIYSLRYPELIDVVEQLRGVLRRATSREDPGPHAASG